MTMREIYVASSSLPNGRSWLDNCLMELGVMWTYLGTGEPHDSDWEKLSDERWRYRHRDKPLGFDIMYPALMREEGNVFDLPFRARGVHDYFGERHRDLRSVLVVRDVCEVMRSSFKRQGARGSALPVAEYNRLIDPWTLLPILESFGLLSYSWASQDGVKVVKQEDYRRDPEAILRETCTHYGIEVDDARIKKAVDESSFAKMQKCEVDTRLRVYGDRSAAYFLADGRVHGSGELDNDFESLRPSFIVKIGYALSLCGYDVDGPRGFSSDVVKLLRRYGKRPPFIGTLNLDTLPIDPEVGGFDAGMDGHLERLRTLSTELNDCDNISHRSENNLYGWWDNGHRRLAQANLAALGFASSRRGIRRRVVDRLTSRWRNRSRTL